MVEYEIYPIQINTDIKNFEPDQNKVFSNEEKEIKKTKRKDIQNKIEEERRIRERRREKDEITIEGLKELMKKYNYKLRFQEDEKAELIYISIVDPETNKPVKEIPPEEVRKIKEYINTYLKDMVGNNLDLKG